MQQTDIQSQILELTDTPRQEAENRWVDYRRVDDRESKRIKSETGLDVAGFMHMIDKSAVNHILNRHGPGKEQRKNQIPVTKEDIAGIPEITAMPDSIERSPKKNKLALDVIRYRKRQNNIIFVVVEEIRPGRKKLAVATMYKVATGVEGATTANQQASAIRPKRSPARHLL